MKDLDEILSIEKAYSFLEDAPRKNKELWIKHSVNVAIVAERLAEQLKLDSKKAYVLGLVHDIGRRKKEHVGLRHIIEGYNFLEEQGYKEEARVCLTHTFYSRNLVKPNLTKANTNLTRNEIEFISDYINKNGFNIYDKILHPLLNLSFYNLLKSITIIIKFNLYHIIYNIKKLIIFSYSCY